MEMKYHPRFVEKALHAEIRARERRGDRGLREQYGELSEPLYALAPGARDAEFKRVNLAWFLELGLHAALEEILHESSLRGQVAETVIVESEAEEMADLFHDGDRLRVVMRMKPESLLDTSRLPGLLRHELAHLADMLDPEFQYERDPLSSSPIEDTILRERYRVLWDITIDSRLIKSGRPTVATKALRQREFLALYQKFGKQECEAVFEYLWSRDRTTHPELREFAKDPRALLRAAGIEARKSTVLPGLLCPICGFPTYQWAMDPDHIEGDVMEHIKQDVPDWKPEQGLCERCLEAWSLRAQGL
jgi:hypothetical protein